MKKILVIDDEELLRTTMVGVLRAQGYEALETGTAADGLALAAAQYPDLVLCDFALNESDGLEVLQELRRQPATASLPFILMTGREEATLMRQGMDLGADDFLRKPFTDTQLLTTVQSRLRHREDLIQRERVLLRTLIDHLPDPVYAKDLEGRKTLANRADYGNMGCASEEEALGKCDAEIYPAEIAAQFVADDQAVLQTGNPVINREEYMLDAQGRRRWLLTSKLPLRDNQGRIIGLVGIGRDITQRKEMEEKLRILSRAVEQSPASVVITDTTGRIEYANPKFCAVTGYALAEVLGQNPRVLKSGETPAAEYVRLWATISGGGEWRGEFHNKKKSGELYWESAVVSPIKDDQGVVTHYLAVKEDITERKRAAEALAQLHRRKQLILNSVAEGILQIDLDGHPTFANQAALRMLGWEWGDLAGRSSHDLWHHTRANGHPYPQEECQICATLRDGRTRQVDDEVFWRRDGTSFPVVYISTSIRDGERMAGVAVTFHDISQQKAAESERQRIEIQLRQAQKLESIGQLAAGIAHEINTPTQYIGDNIRFLQTAFKDLGVLFARYDELILAAQTGLAAPELDRQVREAKYSADFEYMSVEIPKAIQQSLEGVERVAKIVRAMKEFSHPGAQQKTFTDLNHAIESTLTVARNEWKYVANLETDFDPALPLVPCLPGEFNQVILNLVINAAHAIAEVVGDGGKGKGTIAVSTRRDDAWVEICIRDTGAGIPAKIREKVFDPFFTTKPVGKGTGQGLAIARSVVIDKHGGTIQFESECGRGTTFHIRLPLKDVRNPAEKNSL